MTLQQYKECVNMLGQVGWQFQGARRLADTPQICGAVDNAFELAGLALHTLVGEVADQAERNSGDAAVEVLGDSGACLESQESMLEDDSSAPYWRIA